jgi:hypothetical protein
MRLLRLPADACPEDLCVVPEPTVRIDLAELTRGLPR